VFAIIYSVAQIADVLGLLPAVWNLVLLFAPSLPLSWCFVVLMVSIHYYAPTERRVWSHIGLIFATMYAVFASIVYFVELTVVVPHMFSGEAEKVGLFLFIPGSFMTGLDALAYCFMSLATLFAAPVFGGGKLQRWIRWAFIANGVLAPAILLVQVLPGLLILGALWLVTFPLSAVLAIVLFKRLSLEAA